MRGTISGLIMVRQRGQRMPLVTGVMVRLDDGQEIRAKFDLKPMPYIGKEYFHLGAAVDVAMEDGPEWPEPTLAASLI